MGNKYTEAQKRASLNYQKDKAQIKITVSKEQRDQFQQHAENKNTTLKALIVDLLNEDIKNTRVKKFEDGVNKAFKRGAYSEHKHK